MHEGYEIAMGSLLRGGDVGGTETPRQATASREKPSKEAESGQCLGKGDVAENLKKALCYRTTSKVTP